MQNADNNIDVLIDKINALQVSINTITETLKKMEKNKITFGDFVSEKEAIEITGLSRSSLLNLRREGKLNISTLTGKQKFYRLSDFKKLLEKNEEEI